jgi:aerobic carbon-monoxide dehydrogenase large subunit
MTTSESGWIGKRYSRREDPRLLTGKGQYLADLRVVRDPLVVKFARSSVAHARIKSIDVSAAARLPGVVLVLTGEDIRERIRPLPTPSTVPLLPGHYPTHWPLAVDRVKFHGEPVVAVVATDKYTAEDAIELIQVEYEDLPPITDPEKAMGKESPLVHPEIGTNVMFHAVLTGGMTEPEQTANSARVAAIFEAADVVIKERFYGHRCGVMPLETRGAVASWDPEAGLRVWMSTQRPHIDRLVFSELFDIPQNQVQVSAPRDQGGAFGVKAPVYREPIMVVYLTKLLGRPVQWIETREEHLMAVSQERDQIHEMELAADRDGRIIGLRDRVIADNGDSCEGVFWGFIMPFYGAALVPNAYHIPDCDISITAVATNKSALSPARAFGSLPGRFALDRAIDMLARRVGKDAADVRRMNLITQLPCNIATGVHYDSGNFVGVWDKLVQHIDVPKFREEQLAARAQGRYIGLGFGVAVHASGVASEALVPMEGQPGYGSATLKMDSSGTVTVFEGDAPQGQGHETTMAQIAAEILGISPDDVAVRVGDTNNTPFASGTFGARGGSYTASAVAMAAVAVREKIVKVVAHDNKLEADPANFRFEGKAIWHKDREQPLTTVADVANRIIMKPLDLPAGVDAGLEHTAFFEAKEPMMAFSAHATIVEVDASSGEFKILRYVSSEDVGRVINPMIVEGQVRGGVVQGLSNAMFEEFIYDENGQQLTSSMENYMLANAADVPNIEVVHADTPCEHTPLGTRGMGEGVPGPVPGALCNAICDALAPFGIEIRDLPVRPDRVWALLQASSTRPGGAR